VSALLSLARQHRQTSLALAAIGGGGDKLLLQRARKMLQQKEPHNRPKPRSLLFLLPMLFLVILSIGLSSGLSGDPAQRDAQSNARPTRVSVDRIDRGQPLPELVLFTPASIPSGSEVLPAPLQNRIVADNRSASMPASHRHNSLHRSITVSPKAKLAWMELMTEKTFQIQMVELQTRFQAELADLRDRQANVPKAVLVEMRGIEPKAMTLPSREQLLKEFLQRQIQLQQEYQNRMDELQRQWLKMGHRLTIVYI
jgi:hypothetical protein